MQKILKKITLSLVLVSSTACSTNFRDTFGLRRDMPDEFSVISSAPLIVPPEFTLRPPVPGARGPQSADLSGQARDILLENSVKSDGPGDTKAESAFLSKAGALSANPQIKEVITTEEMDAINAEKNKTFLQKINIFSRPSPKKDPNVSAVKEQARIVQNNKEGLPTDNDSKPVLAEGGKGVLLNHVFGF